MDNELVKLEVVYNVIADAFNHIMNIGGISSDHTINYAIAQIIQNLSHIDVILSVEQYMNQQ